MNKVFFWLLSFLGGLVVVQGCTVTPTHKSEVSITLRNGQRKTLYFKSLLYDKAKPFREFLEKLQAGEEVDVNKPIKLDNIADPDYVGEMPLTIAIEYGLGERYSLGGLFDENFNAARYLLEKGADPNSGLHELCSRLWDTGDVGKLGLALLLSYGAPLDIPYKDRSNRNYCTPTYTLLHFLEAGEPWISKERRKQYEEKEEEPAPGSEKKHMSPEEIAAEQAVAAWRRDAWKREIDPDEQKKLKQEYFTDIAKELQKEPQYRAPVDAAFLEYIKQAGVDKKLITELENKPVRTDP